MCSLFRNPGGGRVLGGRAPRVHTRVEVPSCGQEHLLQVLARSSDDCVTVGEGRARELGVEGGAEIERHDVGLVVPRLAPEL